MKAAIPARLRPAPTLIAAAAPVGIGVLGPLGVAPEGLVAPVVFVPPVTLFGV